ncbi:MAG: HAMP domain-containing histidine kinase [Bacteroidales bacterium]|nr:HAMP domain-containing histidine kinase [Bacteroidales bacterium]
MKFRSVLLCFLFGMLSVLTVVGATHEAVRGVLDLRQIQDSKKFNIKLNGEWEFYWNRMLRPYDFQGKKIRPDFFGKVPSYWTDYSGNTLSTTKEGFATYRLTILLPPGLRETLAVDLPVFDSSYDIYINDKYYGGNGVPGLSAEETKPEYKRNFFRVDPGSDTLTIIINVANFHHRRGGFWMPMRLGTFDEVRQRLANSWAGEWAIISLLFGFSLFFLFFFIIYPKDLAMGFLTMATIGLSFRPLFTSHFLVSTFLDLGWNWIVKFEYMGLYVILLGWIWFVSTVYPTKYFTIFTKVITLYFLLAFILTIFLPVKIFSYNTMIIYPSMLILMAYAMLQSFRGVLKKNGIDILYFSAFLLLVAGGIHDTSVSMSKSLSTSGYILTYVVVLFVFIQAALLIYKWVKSYFEKEKLQNELEFLNKNLEVMVNERTQALLQQNEEIEQKNIRIASQNKQLTETIHLKNKIFSLVAHDLRSPVVNILYMLNLLKEKEYREKYDEFANSSIQYAQMVISLLENMLVWGRGQEDKIKYSPGKHNMADIILTNLSIFKETADKKAISVNFTQVGNSIAYIDKDLLDIVIRNLLSNAVKYTPRGGRISILLKDMTEKMNGILVRICDNGIGISPGKQKYLFTSAEIASTPGTENEKGTGLGLKLCYELILINKGTITIDSKEGEGACFSITLPSK